MKKRVDILLSTFNGERYVKELVRSIQEQTHTHYQLIIRDDCSRDGTVEVLHELAEQDPDRIKMIQSTRNIGLTESFSVLLDDAESDYIMFADQDDVWLPNKIELAMTKMEQMEKAYGIDTPLLVHSDLKVVDANLNKLSSSFWKYSKLFPGNGASLNRLLVQNVVTGCSMMFNKQLFLLAKPIPSEALQHDWWIALVAAALGEIDLIKSPTILYRQHSGNAIGAMKFNPLKYFWVRMQTPVAVDLAYRARNRKQAQLIFERYKNKIQPNQKVLLKDYCSMHEGSFVRNLLLSLKHGFCKHGFWRNFIGLIPKFKKR